MELSDRDLGIFVEEGCDRRDQRIGGRSGSWTVIARGFVETQSAAHGVTRDLQPSCDSGDRHTRSSKVDDLLPFVRVHGPRFDLARIVIDITG